VVKEKTSQGEEVYTLEAKLEKAFFSASSNVEEFRVHEDCSKKLRSFYSSSNRANRLRSLEIQKKKKYLDKVTAQERKFLTKADKKQLLMFIGDRGTGVGSRIKGFRRY
jgi:hypothetical protein